jgi:hypothetical protein
MTDFESMTEAIKLIAGAIADQLENRQALIDDLHATLVTVRDDQQATPETVAVLQAVIDYVQAGVDVDQIRFRPKAE